MNDRSEHLSRNWTLGLAALCALLSAMPPLFSGELGTDENRVAIEKWVYSRERKTITSSNRVIANFSVKNVSGQDLEGVSVQVTLISGLGEKVAGPLKQDLGSIKPKGNASAQVSANLVPAFGAYEIVVSYQGGQEIWYSNSDMTDPQPKPKGLAENTARVVVVGQEVGPDKASQLSGQLRVRNEGALEAKDVKMVVTYWGADKGGKRVKLGEWTGPLGNGKVPPGKDVTVPVRVPQRVPAGMLTFEIKVTSPEAPIEAQLSGGEFTNAKDIEVAQMQFKRVGAKQQDLEVSCRVRNGLGSDVRDLRLTFDFVSGTGEKRAKVKNYPHTVAGPLKPGEIVPTTFVVKDMPSYDSYECQVGFGGVADAQSAEKKPATPQHQNKATVEVLFKEVITADDGMVVVSCSARNGLAHQVKDVLVVLRLLKQDGTVLKQSEKKLSDPLLSGEEASFVIRVPGGKGFASYDSRVTFLQVPGNGSSSTAPQVETMGNVKTVEPKAPEQKAPEAVPVQAPVAPSSQKQAAKNETPAPVGGPLDLP